MQPRSLVRQLIAAGVIAAAGIGFYHAGAQGVGTAHAAETVPPALASAPPVAPVVQGLPNFTALVKQYGPAVVNIRVTAKVSRMNFQGGPGNDESDDDPFSQLFPGFRFRTPRQPRADQLVRGLGSGFIVSPEGYIMTNAHVVDGATEVTVRLTDRREYKAKVVGADKKSDIAVIKIDAKNLPVVRLGNASNVQVGEWVLAIGAPYGFENSVTSGIISAKARSLPDEAYVPFIQTDVPVNPGNSGGPLFNMNGEVVGINSQIFSQTGGYQGLSFAIPIDIAVRVKDELISHGRVTRGRLGVTIQDVNQQFANSFGLPRPMGALVSDVEKDGPAAQAKLQAGDVITKVDGREVDTSSDLPTRIAELKPGSHAQLEVWRSGKPLQVAVTIGELKDRSARQLSTGEADHAKLGLAVRPLTPDERSQIGSSGGLLVQNASGPAAEAGVQPGDVILAVNGREVKSVEDLRNVVAKAQSSVAVLIQRNDAKIFVPIELG